MDLMGVAFPLAWLTLMGAPIIALIVRFSAKLSSRANVARAGVTIALVVLAWTLSVDFLWRPINWLALAMAYLSWAVLVGATFRIRPRLVGVLLGSLGFATFLPGLSLGTIGIIGLAFVLGDYATPPTRSITVRPGLDCVVTGWGNVTSDEGHEVHLYRYLIWLPLLRQQVKHVVVDETNPWNGIPASTSCKEVVAGRY